MFEDINFGKGVNKKYIDFDVNKDIPLEEQIDLLKEDLLQVSYDNDYIIDMGWYPEFDEEGNFRVSVIKDYQWDNPILQKNCRDLNLLNEYVHECIKLIEPKSK
ncbi:hypothetical protein [Clostridium sporogenes]|uniref:hypothetical protein n=1 Tax=Clostridium sporogenes TaxID=1509 RepID=UPI0013D29A53|nr:hypothetical protein [Clostridium sporogenes]MCW6111094.1 hypothetical protein [Clostridium sporogenes]NFP90985.1 hypothetical protein [Clostridium sporogenes]